MIAILCLSVSLFVPTIFLAVFIDITTATKIDHHAAIAGVDRPSIMVTGLTVAQECAFWGITVDEFNARLEAK